MKDTPLDLTALRARRLTAEAPFLRNDVLALLDRVEKAEREASEWERSFNAERADKYMADDNAKAWRLRAEAAEAKVAAVREHCEGAEWMTDENGDQWQVVTVGVIFNALGRGE